MDRQSETDERLRGVEQRQAVADERIDRHEDALRALGDGLRDVVASINSIKLYVLVGAALVGGNGLIARITELVH